MPSDHADIVTADPTLVGTLYTTGEVAKMVRVHQRTIQVWIRDGCSPETDASPVH